MALVNRDSQRREGSAFTLQEMITADDYDTAWPWATKVLHRSFFQLPSGRFAIVEDPSDQPSRETLEKCRRLAKEAAVQFEGGNRLHSPDYNSVYEPFYVASNPSFSAERIDAHCISAVFGAARHPEAEIRIESMDEQAEWWREVVSYCEASRDPDSDGEIPMYSAYRKLRRWFGHHPELNESAYVTVDASEGVLAVPGDWGWFLELMLGRTHDGSLVGVIGVSRHT